MKWKKAGLFLCSALLILTLILTACAPATEEATEAPPPPPPEDTEPAPEPTDVPEPTEVPPPEPVTIRIAFWELFGIIEPRVQAAVDRFTELYPHITVEFIISPDAFTHRDTVLTMMAAGDPPDVLWSGDSSIWDFAYRGALMDLTPYMERDGIDSSIFVPAVEEASIEGKYYALPDHSGPLMVYYNRDMYDAAGLEYPITNPTDEWTWDTFLANAEAITQVGADGRVETFGMDPWTIWFHWLPTIWTFGGDVINDARTESRLNEPEAIAAMQTITDTMLTDPIVAPSSTAFTELGVDLLTLLLTQRCAHLGAGAWGPSLFTNPATMEPAINWGLAPYPTEVVPATVNGFVGWAAAAGSQHPEEAWMLLKFLSTDVESQRDVARRGIGHPGLLEAYAYGDFMMAYQPDTDLDIWLHSAERSSGVPYHAQWTRTVEGVVTEEFSLMFVGEKTVEEAMADAATRMNEILAQPLE